MPTLLDYTILGHQAQLAHVSCLYIALTLMQLVAPFLVALWVASFLHLQACWTSMVWSAMEGVEATEQPMCSTG